MKKYTTDFKLDVVKSFLADEGRVKLLVRLRAGRSVHRRSIDLPRQAEVGNLLHELHE